MDTETRFYVCTVNGHRFENSDYVKAFHYTICNDCIGERVERNRYPRTNFSDDAMFCDDCGASIPSCEELGIVALATR